MIVFKCNVNNDGFGKQLGFTDAPSKDLTISLALKTCASTLTTKKVFYKTPALGWMFSSHMQNYCLTQLDTKSLV
jgi:hypothetical protein